MAEQKTEAIVFTKRWFKSSMSLRCGTTMIESQKSIKYLGVILDQRMNFIEHSHMIFKNVSDTIRKLGYILPNVGGAKKSRRRLLANVAISRLCGVV